MRLQPIDVYILDFFRRSARVRVERSELSTRCGTYDCSDIEAALTRLERQAHMLRHSTDGRDWIELTREGRQFAGLAAAESFERWEEIRP